jgi:membrane protease YdiL (CAAX protease family)
MFAIGMTLNPITEEWLYRGVLVTWAYTLTDSVGTIAVAVAVSAILHSYQKAIALPFHVLFATAACCVVLSPLGYLGAVGMHMAGDLYPLARMKSALHRWKRTVRARASARA